MPVEIAALMIIAGRVLLGGLFIIGGLQHFRVIEPITGAIAARGVPFPKFVLIFGSIYQIVFGALLALGLFVPLSALALVVFILLATPMLVNFWDKQGAERTALMNVFFSNLALLGGLLIAAATAWGLFRIRNLCGTALAPIIPVRRSTRSREIGRKFRAYLAPD